MALDGDGDRVVMVDELGRCVDGDQLLYILATARRAAGELKGPVVGTVMSNLGLEHALGGTRHRISARAGRRSLRPRDAERGRAAPWAARPRATSCAWTRPRPAMG